MAPTEERRRDAVPAKTGRSPGLIGLAGLLGGALLAVTTVIHNALAVEPETLGGTLSGVAHAVAYALLLLVLLGVHAENEAHYGRKGNIDVSVLAVALGTLVVLFPLLTFVYGFDWTLGGVLAGLAFVVIHLFGVIYGVILWQATPVSRIPAGVSHRGTARVSRDGCLRGSRPR